MAGEPVRSKFLNEWIASCPCRLAGVAAIHCLAVNIAQSMALGHSLHASNAWSCFGRAGSCARGALDGARSEDASTAPPRYNGPFCDSVSRRAEPACLFSPTDQRAGRDSCSASWHPVSVASLYRIARTPMDKTYQPHAIETSWYQTWEQNNYFAPQRSGEPYTIALPPPNVTGSLHMGHGFNNSMMDALIRFRRMQGRNTQWQPGTDHAGIATQMVVERQLAAQGESRHDLGREQDVEKGWAWKEQSGGTITSQIRRLGSSVDWTRERFTMDEGLSEAVKEAFVRLYEDGLIYRGKRLVNWDPKLHTAISDLEVENHDETGSLWHLRYPLADGATTADGKNYLIVATTRPETMLGDTAVAVNP